MQIRENTTIAQPSEGCDSSDICAVFQASIDREVKSDQESEWDCWIEGGWSQF